VLRLAWQETSSLWEVREQGDLHCFAVPAHQHRVVQRVNAGYVAVGGFVFPAAFRPTAGPDG